MHRNQYELEYTADFGCAQALRGENVEAGQDILKISGLEVAKIQMAHIVTVLVLVVLLMEH